MKLLARTLSRKWELNSNWLTAGKECGSVFSSRLWGGALRDNTKNGCVADYFNLRLGFDLQPIVRVKPTDVLSFD